MVLACGKVEGSGNRSRFFIYTPSFLFRAGLGSVFDLGFESVVRHGVKRREVAANGAVCRERYAHS
jgi:hypothetical protein